MQVTFTPIGFVRTEAETVPRHWTVSDVKGTLEIHKDYAEGLSDIQPGQKIIVLFWFHKSQPFEPRHLHQTPPHRDQPLGVFSICSPVRPNPMGLSVVKVVDVRGNRVFVEGIDMLDGTPILDIKPHIQGKTTCPSYEDEREPCTP